MKHFLNLTNEEFEDFKQFLHKCHKDIDYGVNSLQDFFKKPYYDKVVNALKEYYEQRVVTLEMIMYAFANEITIVKNHWKELNVEFNSFFSKTLKFRLPLIVKDEEHRTAYTLKLPYFAENVHITSTVKEDEEDRINYSVKAEYADEQHTQLPITIRNIDNGTVVLFKNFKSLNEVFFSYKNKSTNHYDLSTYLSSLASVKHLFLRLDSLVMNPQWTQMFSPSDIHISESLVQRNTDLQIESLTLVISDLLFNSDNMITNFGTNIVSLVIRIDKADYNSSVNQDKLKSFVHKVLEINPTLEYLNIHISNDESFDLSTFHDVALRVNRGFCFSDVTKNTIYRKFNHFKLSNYFTEEELQEIRNTDTTEFDWELKLANKPYYDLLIQSLKYYYKGLMKFPNQRMMLAYSFSNDIRLCQGYIDSDMTEYDFETAFPNSISMTSRNTFLLPLFKANINSIEFHGIAIDQPIYNNYSNVDILKTDCVKDWSIDTVTTCKQVSNLPPVTTKIEKLYNDKKPYCKALKEQY